MSFKVIQLTYLLTKDTTTITKNIVVRRLMPRTMVPKLPSLLTSANGTEGK